ncbi:MAG: OmpH family outer membrane protein [Elusimicrobia bacterium]|nr:OmpH family outer membrane protein [Elusimicrobiota bacterium]
MKELLFAALLALPAAKANALELLLEENRGESGTIGYVDIDRVFKEYSGTTGAREDFLAEIKKKEDSLNARKTEIFTLKAEIAKLRQEREFALTLPSLMETRRSVAEAAAQAAQAVSTETVSLSTSSPEASTSAVQGAAAPVPSTAVPAGLPGMTGIDMPGVARVPVSHFKFSVSTSVPEIDAAITGKETDLSRKEESLRQAQKQAERELLDYESRKSELLLGRIYVALKELATKEEVSVVVDKRNILYGQHAVDLTDKLMKKLEEGGL